MKRFLALALIATFLNGVTTVNLAAPAEAAARSGDAKGANGGDARSPNGYNSRNTDGSRGGDARGGNG